MVIISIFFFKTAKLKHIINKSYYTVHILLIMFLLSLVFQKHCFNALSHVKHFQTLLAFTLKCLPFTLKCLPFALKSSRTSTYEITCIYIHTQLKHASFLSELYTFVNFILYVLWVYARIEYVCVCVFIGVYAWIKFICICEYV